MTLPRGGGRTAGREKAHHYEIARGSANECAAALDLLAIRGRARGPVLERALGLLHEVVRMLTALARNARERAEAG